MTSYEVYRCPKCHNTLLYSNKMLHDLKCTEEMPATYANILRSSYTVPQNYNTDVDSQDYSGVRGSIGASKRLSFMNNDGTTTEIKKDTCMSGKEELLAITYDPQGNVIARKKADGGRASNVKFKFHEMQEVNEYDPNENYYMYEGGNVYVQAQPPLVSYEILEPKYVTETDYSNLISGKTEILNNMNNQGYNMLNNNISGINMDDIFNNNQNNITYTNNTTEYDFNTNVNNINIGDSNITYDQGQNFSSNYFEETNENNNDDKFARVTKLGGNTDNDIDTYQSNNNYDFNSFTSSYM